MGEGERRRREVLDEEERWGTRTMRGRGAGGSKPQTGGKERQGGGGGGCVPPVS